MTVRKRAKRWILAALLAAAATVFFGGCATTVADKPVFVRVGYRMPGVITQDPNGESQYQAPVENDKDDWMLIVRVQF